MIYGLDDIQKMLDNIRKRCEENGKGWRHYFPMLRKLENLVKKTDKLLRKKGV